MSHPTQTDLPTTPIVTRTVQVLHDFVRDAVSHLSEALNDSAPEFDYNVRLERGSDGVFRERKKRIPTLPLLTTESLQALPNYAQCIESLRSDAVVGPHLDRLVGGTNIGSRRLGVGGILGPLIFAMSDEEGHLTFTSQKFYKRWQEFGDFFGTDRIVYKTVAPLPNLIVPAFPLRLNNEVFLDRLTEDEVTRCYQLGMIRPHFSGFHPIVYGEWAVGIRRITFSPKLIREGDEPLEPLDVGDEGSFGDRPLFRSDIIIDDVLSTLRLFKHTQIRAAGLVSGADPPWLTGVTQSRVLGTWPYGPGIELSEGEVPQLLELWRLLDEGGAARFGFSIRRFNLSFERGLLDDRIVDLIIAAEALFLRDLGRSDRGELQFRVALRAAKFVEHPSYSEYEVFHIMRRAYGVRSAIVHGGSPKDTRLPDNPSANLPTFTDAVEDLVRLGLRKALSMKEDGMKMRRAEYWDSLVFSNAVR